MYDDQCVKRNDRIRRERRKQILVDPAHDCHEAIVAVLAVDCGRQKILDIAFIVAKCVEQTLHAEGADPGMSGRDIWAYRDLRSDICKARFKPFDGRRIVALGEARLRD